MIATPATSRSRNGLFFVEAQPEVFTDVLADLLLIRDGDLQFYKGVGDEQVFVIAYARGQWITVFPGDDS